MLGLALSTVRARKGGFAGAFVALLLATTLVAACGMLLQTGQRADIDTERYAGTPVVVAGHQRITRPDGDRSDAGDADAGDLDAEPLTERARVDRELTGRMEDVHGVRAAIPEVSFSARVVTASGALLSGPAGQDSEDNSWGHAWESAQLTPFALIEGDAPVDPDEVVLDAELARRADARPGDEVAIQATSALRTYHVTGIAAPPDGEGLPRQSALFFSSAEAERLAGHPDTADAIGVLADAGVDADALRDRIRGALEDEATVRVHSGDDRGAVEFLDAAEARELLVGIVSSFGGVALMVALFVVASTFALLVQQRSREVALLRAVAATPRQVRRMICREAQVVALAAGIVGVVPAAGLAAWMRAEFADRRLIPESFALYVGPLPMLVAFVAVVGTAWLAAWVAARRASRIEPVQALGEAAVEPKRMGLGRLVAGLLVLVLGVGLLALSTQLRGEAAAGVGVAVVIPLVTAAALLSPILARVAAGLLGWPLRTLSGRSGYLAVANTRANTRRLGSVITPLILAVGVGGVVLFQQSTIDRLAHRQARAGMLADRVIVSDVGLPAEVARTAADVPGVATATAVAQTDVTVEYTELGDPMVQVFTAQGVGPGAHGRSLDLDVRDGSLQRLEEGTVAVSKLLAETVGVEVGERLPLWLGDGAAVEPVVVAIYDRGFGFGELTFPRSTLDGHLTDPLDDMVLLRTADGADLAQVDAALADLPYAGLTVLDRAGIRAAGSEAGSADAWLHLLLAGVLLGYVAISVANSLIVGTSARARELALLRLIGTTQRQVIRMMRWEALIVVATAIVVGGVIAGTTLTMLAYGLTGDPVPYVPPLPGAALLAAVVALGMTAIALPTRYALRSNPTETISIRE
jgi:putative ABC transport system permease protein